MTLIDLYLAMLKLRWRKLKILVLMKYRERYPKDWEVIALRIKQQANWQCQMCGLKCISSEMTVNTLDRSQRAIYRLEVHHINRKPEDNRIENLIALCSSCHLRQHRRKRGNVPFGQLNLSLGI